jgi:hypothetical protein
LVACCIPKGVNVPQGDSLGVILQDRLAGVVETFQQLQLCQLGQTRPDVFVQGDETSLDELQDAGGCDELGHGHDHGRRLWRVGGRVGREVAPACGALVLDAAIFVEDCECCAEELVGRVVALRDVGLEDVV